MMVDPYQGDPKVFITNDGAEIVVRSGNPIMDGGLENAVLISLFSKEGWVGNTLFTENDQKIGSKFQDKGNGPVTLTRLNDLANSAEVALQWMIDAGIVSSVEAVTRNPSGNILETEILLTPLGKDVQSILIQQNGQNWIIQINDPAHRRI